MKKYTFILLLIALSTTISFGQKTKKQSNKEKFVQTVNFLEANPLDQKARDLRSWALKWSYNTKEVTTVVCDNIFGIFLAKEVRGELLSQYLIKMTAYKLEDQKNRNDENAVQLAAMESVLKVYEKIIKDDPNSKVNVLDRILIVKDAGKLQDFIKNLECGK